MLIIGLLFFPFVGKEESEELEGTFKEIFSYHLSYDEDETEREGEERIKKDGKL